MQRAIDLQLHDVVDHSKVDTDLFIAEIALSCTDTMIINLCILRRNSIWLLKGGGQTILAKYCR